MIEANPLIADTPTETIHHVVESLNALMRMMAHYDSDLCRLISPIQHALEHASRQM